MGKLKINIRFCAFFVSSIFFGIIGLNQSFAQSQADSCGQSVYDRAVDRGIYLWQNCGTGEWFLRTTGGGRPSSNEFRVEGTLVFSEPVQTISGFSIDEGKFGSQDLLDTSNPNNIKFRLRVWADAQDGIDFRIPNNSKVCLYISNPANEPVFVGSSNTKYSTLPLNLLTFEDGGCSSTMSSVMPLLLD